MLEETNYYNAFKKGFYYVLYNDDETRETPIVKLDDLESIGYNAGFQYGEYCELTSQTMSISGEQLLAVMSKSYSRAVEQRTSHQKREKQYVIYKNAFVEGKNDVLLKYYERDESFNLIPDLDATDIHSIGYYDGYCYYLRKVLSVDDLSELEELPKLEEVCRENFNQSEKSYCFDKLEVGINK